MRDMRRLIGELAAEGLTVLLSSHLMNEVEQLCTQLAIIARGRIQFAGTIDELRSGHAGADYRLEVTDLDRAVAVAAGLAEVDVCRGDGEDRSLLVTAGPAAAADLTVRLGEAGIGIYGMLPAAPSLEQLFFELTEQPPA
jgi:ABC-2 type transport system ATP-binding protein